MTLKWINPYGFYGKDIDIVVAGLLKICYNVLVTKVEILMSKEEMQKKLDDIVRSEKSFLEKAYELRVLFRSDMEVFCTLNTDEITTSPLGKFICDEWDYREERKDV